MNKNNDSEIQEIYSYEERKQYAKEMKKAAIEEYMVPSLVAMVVGFLVALFFG